MSAALVIFQAQRGTDCGGADILLHDCYDLMHLAALHPAFEFPSGGTLDAEFFRTSATWHTNCREESQSTTDVCVVIRLRR
ncbi:MAG TPA: hypothetical protein VMV81_03830 [Phycisphaerae bacterium]|nr:hypothetical protein [Phycisphaerae bacterium]